MKLHELVETSRAVAGTSARLEKTERLASFLRRVEPGSIDTAVAWLCGELRQGRIGVGSAAFRDAFPETPADEPTLTLDETDRVFAQIAAVSGRGSTAERRRLLTALLARATRPEQEFLVKLVFGELRQGALEGVMVEAVARAADVTAADIRRARMLTGDLREVASAVLLHGEAGLSGFSLKLLRPVKPMLAQPAEAIADALGRMDAAAFEFKLDGARVQVHKAGDEVRVFTRRLNDVTAAVPEIVELAKALPAEAIILDGEALALRADGKPHPFQVTMRRFGRKLDVEGMRRELPLASFFFDCLYCDGEALIDRGGGDRFTVLSRCLPEGIVIPRITTADQSEAEAFLEQALERGHEGVMAKALDATYEAGARGASWLKVKRTHTLDLVVLAAEWGHGRRRGWLSNLHLGARDPATGGFVMLGKTFKGMTDDTLEWQTGRLQEIEVSRDRYTVYVLPDLVVEVAFSDVQESPQYPGGLALRFARLKRYRPDKRPEQADTIDMVRGIHQASTGGIS
ncbi:MAG: ATP-dependent DNA ligase [Planctomycetota bacterium]